MLNWMRVVPWLLLPASAFGDQVLLKSGARLDGVIVERGPSSLVIEVAPGRLSIPLARIDSVIEGHSLLASYRERASALDPADVAGWLALAQWAQDRQLLTQARQAFEHVASLDPANSAAQRALGRVQLDGEWMSPEESYRARGYVQYEGRWMTPPERDEAVREAEAYAAGERARLDLEARATEAEAAARIAEADARRAEAEAQTSYGLWGGFAYPWTFVGSPPLIHNGAGCARPRPTTPTRGGIVQPLGPIVQPPRPVSPPAAPMPMRAGLRVR